MDLLEKTTRERLYDLRSWYGTNKAVAESLGVSPSTLRRWKREGVPQARERQLKTRIGRRERYFKNERPKVLEARGAYERVPGELLPQGPGVDVQTSYLDRIVDWPTLKAYRPIMDMRGNGVRVTVAFYKPQPGGKPNETVAVREFNVFPFTDVREIQSRAYLEMRSHFKRAGSAVDVQIISVRPL